MQFRLQLQRDQLAVPVLLPPGAVVHRSQQALRPMPVQVPVVHQMPPGLLRMTEARSRSALGSPAERLLGLAVSPSLIAAAITVAAVSVTAVYARDLPVWLVLAAAAAGWSSAWSP